MLLLIPGPVTTSRDVREAMLTDFAPWDRSFMDLHARLRARLLAIAGGRTGEHATLDLPGCGHYALEAAVRTFIPPGGTLIVPLTGAYGERLHRLAAEAGRRVVALPIVPNRPIDPAAVAEALAGDPAISHVGMVYSETGTGVCHDVAAVGEVARRLGRRMIVDAVSAFGALPFDISAQPECDAVAFTANKCLEGVPGAAFVIARVDRLSKGNAGSWSFDLADIFDSLRDSPGASRFTPPVQVLNALDRALDRLDAETRVGRLARYTANMRTLYDGIKRLGLTPVLPVQAQGPIVVNVHAPNGPAWNLLAFVEALKRRGFLISNFHNTPGPSFRVGCIGAITPDDMRRAVTAMGEALDELGIERREAA